MFRTAASLLQAIMDEPGQDLPRLIYADWLEEHQWSARACAVGSPGSTDSTE